MLHAAEREGSRFTHAQVASWDAADLERFERLGILKRIDGSIADCPDCEIGHVGEIHVSIDGAGRQRRHLACPLDGRVEVSADSCSEWVVAPAALAGAVALAFGTTGKPRPVGHGVWKLGRVTLDGASREMVLLLYASDAKSRELATHAGQSGRTILVVPVREPDMSHFDRFIPAVVPLATAAKCTANGLEVDAPFVIDLVRAADESTRIAREHGGESPRMARRLKRMIRAESKVQLTDDALVAAYVRSGSADKAAAALSTELGRKVSRDSIYRALDKAGGIEAVMRTQDSGSVMRVVASQPRDRAKRKAQSGI